MKPATYKVAETEDGNFLVVSLNVIATFSESGLADEFAAMKNGIDAGRYAASQDGNEFCVSRSEKLAIFLDEGLADEYAGIKNGTPAVRASNVTQIPQIVQAPPEEPIDNDAIWAAAAASVSGGR